MKRFGFVLCVLLGWTNLSFAAEAGIVEAVGEATIKGGDKVAAKKAATADAFKKCIEQVVGIAIESDFNATQREVVKNNQTEFYSKVQDTLKQKAKGFIQKHEVLEEKVEGNVFKIKIRAHVFESKVKAEIQKLTDLIAAAGNPKLMLVIQEVHATMDGTKTLATDSIFAAHLEKQLLERGFELKGKGQAQRKAAASIEEFDAWIENPSEIATLAGETGADIVIAGRLEILNKGIIDDPGVMEALRGQTRVEMTSIIRGVYAATAEVLSAKPAQVSSIGTNMERAVHRALQGRGSNLVKKTFDQLLSDLTASFKKMAKQGQTYALTVNNVTSFRKQGKGFVKILKQLDGVTKVKQKSFRSGTLRVEVTCQCSANELQDRIFEHTEDMDKFATLDIQGITGRNLVFGF